MRHDHFHSTLLIEHPQGDYDLEVEGGWCGFPDGWEDMHFLTREHYLTRISCKWGNAWDIVKLTSFGLGG
jgi:hypothetical protein